MTLRSRRNTVLRFKWRFILLTFSLLGIPVVSLAQQQDEFDQYKLRVGTFWYYSSPSGSLQGSADAGSVDLQKDLGFNSYSTFAGKVDWKFTHKNHLYVALIPLNTSRETTLTRTFVFQGQTFEAGLTSNSELHVFLTAPGYQYDIIRRKRGHLGLGVQIDLFDSSAKISATGQIAGEQKSVSASASLLAPIPVAGPDARLYLTDSPRFFVEGNVYGMYLFGYGNFVSTADDIGVTLTKHISANAGYQLGSRLVVNNSSSADRIGLRLTQSGAVVGLEFSF